MAFSQVSIKESLRVKKHLYMSNDVDEYNGSSLPLNGRWAWSIPHTHTHNKQHLHHFSAHTHTHTPHTHTVTLYCTIGSQELLAGYFRGSTQKHEHLNRTSSSKIKSSKSSLGNPPHLPVMFWSCLAPVCISICHVTNDCVTNDCITDFLSYYNY